MLIRGSGVPSPGAERKPPLHLRLSTHPVNNLIVGTMMRLYARVATGDAPHEPESLRFVITDPQGKKAEYTDLHCDELGTYFVRISLGLAGPYEARVTVGGEDMQVQTLSFVVAE